MSDLSCTNGDIWAALFVAEPSDVPALAHLAKANLPIRVTNNILKLLRLAKAEFEDIAASRAALLDRCVQKDADGKPVSVDDGKQVVLADAATFIRELDELMAISVVLRDVRPVTFDELGEYPISADQLAKLGPFVVETAAPAKPELVK